MGWEGNRDRSSELRTAKNREVVLPGGAPPTRHTSTNTSDTSCQCIRFGETYAPNLGVDTVSSFRLVFEGWTQQQRALCYYSVALTTLLFPCGLAFVVTCRSVRAAVSLCQVNSHQFPSININFLDRYTETKSIPHRRSQSLMYFLEHWRSSMKDARQTRLRFSTPSSKLQVFWTP